MPAEGRGIPAPARITALPCGIAQIRNTASVQERGFIGRVALSPHR